MQAEFLHVVCGRCDAANRVPPGRLRESPKCGKCHAPLFEGHPITLTEASFDRHVAKSDIPIVVEFWAPWCGPCRVMAPAFEQAARQLEPDMHFAKVNTEAEQSLGARFGIRSIPTMMLFKGGRETARQAGAMGAADIARWVQAMLRSSGG